MSSPRRQDERPHRDYVESLSTLFERIGCWSFDHRVVVLAAASLLLVGCALLASRTRFDNSFEAYFAKNDPAYAAYNAFRHDFGSDELAYILYEAPATEHGPFDLEVMRKIASLTEALEREVPFVREVTSLANAELIEGIPDGLRISSIEEDGLESQEALLTLRERILAKPLYVGGLVSADARYGAILVETEKSSVDPVEEIRLDPNGGDELDNLYPQVTYGAIAEILARPDYAGITFHHVGDPAINAIYNRIIADDSGQLALASFAVIGAMLLWFFRRPIGALGPLAVVGLSIMSSLAFVGWMEWRLDLMFTMLPTLLIAVGVADSVHIMSEFREYHIETGDRREAARMTLYLVGAPCLLTSATTAAGFASMSIAPIKAISHFAIYSAVGVIAAFLLSITVLFVFLSFGSNKTLADAERTRQRRRAKGGTRTHAALAAVARFDVRHRRAILACSAVIFAIAAVGVARVRVDSNFINEFDRDEPIRKATELADRIMGGMYSYIFLFDSGQPEGSKDPQLLREIDLLQARAKTDEWLVRKTYSIGDLMKDINKSLHEEDPQHYALPETRELVGQYLLLYEMAGGDELDDYLSGDFARASLELRLRVSESSEIKRLATGLDAYLAEHVPTAARVTATGIGALWLELEAYIISSQIRGFLVAFVVIAAMMCFIFRSVKLGLIAMIPNLSPVVLTLGVMGWTGTPLDYVRLLIASVAIGIAVDDTIHHVTRFHMEFRRCGNYEQALERATVGVGRALFITSAVLVAGFLVFSAARLDSIQSFGGLLAATITIAFLADFLLMPALILTLEPFGPQHTPAPRNEAPLV